MSGWAFEGCGYQWTWSSSGILILDLTRLCTLLRHVHLRRQQLAGGYLESQFSCPSCGSGRRLHRASSGGKHRP
jgi:hypothetical protein